MSSSSPDPIGVAPYPSATADHVFAIYSGLCLDETEKVLIGSLISTIFPPPNIRVFRDAVKVLSKIDLVTDDDANTFEVFAQRSAEHKTLNQRSHEKCYPICFAIRRLFNSGREFPETRDDAIHILVACAQNHPPIEQFTGHMYYKHALGFRDAFEKYWEAVTDARERGDYSRGDQLADVVEFIDERKKSPLLKENSKLKFRIAGALMDNRLLLGGAWPRGQTERKRRCQIGSCVSISANVLEEITPTQILQSAKVEDPFMDDDGISAEIQHADGATTRDKQKVVRIASTAFARTNVRTLADMNALSAVTYSDYLTHAAHFLADEEYALTWLAAFPGIDVSRPLAIRACKDHMPHNDQLILDRSFNALAYNILRRRRRSDPATHESAGIMRLPIPQRVHCGLLQIIDSKSQNDIFESCNRKAQAYSRKHPGLTGTLNRLKSTSRVLLAPRQFSELESCAISGRVVPSLKGISAYYPHRVAPMASKFAKAYDATVSELGIVGPSADELPALSEGAQNYLFCKPSRGIQAAEELMDAICVAYADSCAHLESLGALVTVEDLVGTLILHETACYVLQQIALGIRPIGEVADFVAVSDSTGAMVRDKGSRLFSERSFSPLSHRHSRLLTCAHDNRLLLQQILEFSGLQLVFDEPNSSLACNFIPDPGNSAFRAVRMRNDFVRHTAPVASKIVDSNYEPNWLRHVATEYAANKGPQWQLDEFFSHRRIGREAMSKWSTAGISHFEPLKDHFDELVSKLVADPLLSPIPTYYLKYRSKAG